MTTATGPPRHFACTKPVPAGDAVMANRGRVPAGPAPMPITTADIQRSCYDPINFTPRRVATAGVGGNIKKFDPYDQVTHSVSERIRFGPPTSPGPKSHIRNISFARVAGANSYYLPFESD